MFCSVHSLFCQIFYKIASHRSFIHCSKKLPIAKLKMEQASQNFARFTHYFDKSLSKLLRTVRSFRRKLPNCLLYNNRFHKGSLILIIHPYHIKSSWYISHIYFIIHNIFLVNPTHQVIHF